MFASINPQHFCKIRLRSQLLSIKKFSKSTKTGKWPLKSRGSLHAVSDPVSSSLGLKTLIKPFLFTVTFSGSCFVAASIWKYEEMRKGTYRFMRIPTSLSDSTISSYKRFELYKKINSWWNSQTEGEKVAVVIAGINIFVFCLWKIPSCYPFMRKYFCGSPALKASCLPMILSAFSHCYFFHLALNMLALYEISTTAVEFFGKEQFLLLYCSAAVFSSFTSYVHKIATGTLVASLGASGALFAIISSMCVQYPDTPLQMPFFTIPEGKALKIDIIFEIIGLLEKQRLFDHAAHLGGILLGIVYVLYGKEYIWCYREYVFSWYHKIRERGT